MAFLKPFISITRCYYYHTTQIKLSKKNLDDIEIKYSLKEMFGEIKKSLEKTSNNKMAFLRLFISILRKSTTRCYHTTQIKLSNKNLDDIEIKYSCLIKEIQFDEIKKSQEKTSNNKMVFLRPFVSILRKSTTRYYHTTQIKLSNKNLDDIEIKYSLKEMFDEIKKSQEKTSNDVNELKRSLFLVQYCLAVITSGLAIIIFIPVKIYYKTEFSSMDLKYRDRKEDNHKKMI